METNVTTENLVGKPSLLGMFTSPSAQFTKLKSTKKVWGIFFLVALLQSLINGVSTYVSQNTPEMLELKKQFGDDMQESMGLLIGKAIGTGFLGAVIGTLFVAIVYKVFLVFFGNDTSYKKIIGIITYASIVLLTGALLNALLALIFGGGITGYTNLAFLFSEGTIAYGIASTIEIFHLWYMFLIWIGLQTTAGLSKVKSAVPIIVIFLIQAAVTSFFTIVLATLMEYVK
ncbi:hypothetical protein CN683_24535 [Bacillus toyonensis]|uniref:Yip1 family protein n=1 Tax=Bacillus toyonensis TaxID=155322 RepID=UPI000BF13D60|nr:Yip1 family protein [Bacillus toyonensis]PEK11711.1 hypothetical protein CN683_24535 [Bacillus toyonensis]PGC88866.1 hypothetical protein COM29_10375 [Bacillus toyonensis]